MSDGNGARSANDDDVHAHVVRVVDTIDRIAQEKGVAGDTRADRFKRLEKLIGARARGQLIHLQQYSVPRPQTLRMVADALHINPTPLYIEMGWLTPLEVREAANRLGRSPEEWEAAARRAGLTPEQLQEAVAGLRRLAALECLADTLEDLARATEGGRGGQPIASGIAGR